jgi:hypothetical protein
MARNVPIIGNPGGPADAPKRCLSCGHWHPRLAPCGSVPHIQESLPQLIFDGLMEVKDLWETVKSQALQIEALREEIAAMKAEDQETRPDTGEMIEQSLEAQKYQPGRDIQGDQYEIKGAPSIEGRAKKKVGPKVEK